jgi:hypothetical protein
VGDFVGSLNQYRYHSNRSAYRAEGEKPLAAVDVDAYRALSSDIDEAGSLTFGVRVVAGSNPAAPTKMLERRVGCPSRCKLIVPKLSAFSKIESAVSPNEFEQPHISETPTTDFPHQITPSTPPQSPRSPTPLLRVSTWASQLQSMFVRRLLVVGVLGVLDRILRSIPSPAVARFCSHATWARTSGYLSVPLSRMTY